MRVEGADDTAMVATFDGPGREVEARALYGQVADGVTRADLEALGFTHE